MKIDKTKGLWWEEKKFGFREPTIEEDVAYFLYCKDRPEDRCVPQVGFIHTSKRTHRVINGYYINANRIIKLDKIKMKYHEK